MVTLTANPDPSDTFVDYTGCTATGLTCPVTMTGNKTVDANFMD